MFYNPECLDSLTRSSLLLSIVLPRPVALVTSLNTDDSNTNIAPFSLFNLVSLDPPIVYISIQKTSPPKRTSINILKAEEFVINIPNYAIAEKMNKAAIPSHLIDKKDKFKLCEFTKIESEKIKTCGIKESLIRFECKLHSKIDLIGYEMYLGKILNIYCDDSVLEAGQIVLDKHEFISRLGSKELYARIIPISIFSMKRFENYEYES